MPLLYKRKLATNTALNTISKPNGAMYKKNRTAFKTPVLSKFKLENFVKYIEEAKYDETPSNSSSEAQCSAHMGITHRSQSNIQVEDKLSFENKKSSLVSEDNKQTISDTSPMMLETSLESQMSNQIVPSASPVKSNQTSSNTFQTSKSSSQLTMNDPNIKEEYLDFLQKKNPSQSQPITSSQSSNYSINDPPIKKMYIDFMKNKDNIHKEGSKVNKPKQKKEKTEKKKESRRNEGEVQNIGTIKKVNKKKPKITKGDNICHIDIEFPRTGDTGKTLKDVKNKNKSSHRKKTREHKLPVQNHMSTFKETAKKEVHKVITSTLKFDSHKEKIEWVLESSNIGLYVICDRCEKTRYLKNVQDPLELPEKWYCENNSDTSQNSCCVPEIEIPDEVEVTLIENLYNAGSIVWGRLQGYPWWPAIVDVCPDTEDYFWLDHPEDRKPTWYNVTYFDTSSVTRSWLRVENIIPFRKYTNPNKQYNTKIPRELSYRLEKSIQMAHEALELHLMDRLQHYAFIYRYNKPINKPIGEKKSKRATKHRDKKIFRTKKDEKPKTIERIASTDSDVTTLSDIFPFDLESYVYPI